MVNHHEQPTFQGEYVWNFFQSSNKQIQESCLKNIPGVSNEIAYPYDQSEWYFNSYLDPPRVSNLSPPGLFLVVKGLKCQTLGGLGYIHLKLIFYLLVFMYLK